MVDEVNTFEVIVSSLFEGERVLIVNFYIPNLDRDIDGVFFRGIHYYKKILLQIKGLLYSWKKLGYIRGSNRIPTRLKILTWREGSLLGIKD